MKKITLLFIVFVMTAISFAQVKKMPRQENVFTQNIIIPKQQERKANNITAPTFDNKIIPIQKVIAIIDTAFYLSPHGAFYGGVYANGYKSKPRLVIPPKHHSIYTNASANSATSTWSINHINVSANKNYTATKGYDFGTDYLPKLTTESSSYIYGESVPTDNFVLSGIDYAMPLTLCPIYTALKFDRYGLDYNQVSGGSLGNYAYGTNLHTTVASSETLDTIGSLFRNYNDNVLYIDSVILPIYNESLTGNLIPANGIINMTVYAVDSTANGYHVTDSVIGRASADASNIIYKNSNTIYNYQEETVAFVFSPNPISVQGPFYIELTGFNESGCDFGIYSSFYYPENSTYFTKKGRMTSFWGDGSESNLAISLNAIMPILIPDSTNMKFIAPAKGGFAADYKGNYPGVFSNFVPTSNVGQWEFSNVPDWIDLTYDTTNFSDKNYIVLKFNASALPETESGRQVKITVNCLGKKIVYTIIQGIPTGTQIIKNSDIKVGKTANSFEIENAQGYTSVGLINISGKIIGNYKISNNKVSIPNTELTNGVYILKFEGKKSQVETVKVLK